MENNEIAILAGGCFWCMDGAFRTFEGIVKVEVGYTGGKTPNPTYEEVCSGVTGHYEAVRLEFDPKVVSFEKILDQFMLNIDPTDNGGQFGDRGSSYMTAIFYLDEKQKAIALMKIAQLQNVLNKEIVIAVLPASDFYLAESYHQNYPEKSPARYMFYVWGSGRKQKLESLKKQLEGSEVKLEPLTDNKEDNADVSVNVLEEINVNHINENVGLVKEDSNTDLIAVNEVFDDLMTINSEDNALVIPDTNNELVKLEENKDVGKPEDQSENSLVVVENTDVVVKPNLLGETPKKKFAFPGLNFQRKIKDEVVVNVPDLNLAPNTQIVNEEFPMAVKNGGMDSVVENTPDYLVNNIGLNEKVEPIVEIENKVENGDDTSTIYSKDDLKSRLTDMQFRVTQEAATEPPFANPYWNETREGIYVDIVSGKVLFTSKDKFDSECGWPSFAKPAGDVVSEHEDKSLWHTVRIEVKSKYSGSHLGHVFDDGPKELGGKRYCINSAALKFIPREDLEKEGYGEWRKVFDL